MNSGQVEEKSLRGRQIEIDQPFETLTFLSEGNSAGIEKKASN